MIEEDKIFVIGHLNPDTDSVCSAIAYADLCRKLGRENVQPARAGTINRQTEFVLEAFGQETPQLLNDVFPRLRDILSGHAVTLSANEPLAQALEVMRQHDIRMLPVTDDDDSPLGVLILKRLTEHFLIPKEGRRIRQVLTSLSSIQACLQATDLIMHDPDRSEMLDLYVGAMAPSSFLAHLTKADPATTVVLTGDREDIQLDAIRLGIRLLIITGGLPVSERVYAEAIQFGVSLLQSPFDTATSALLARMSTPVRHLVDKDVPTVNPDDRVENLRRSLMRSRSPGALVLDRAGHIVGVATKSNLLRTSNIKLILVDHNELTQAVPGADQVDILEVIDHHRLGNFHTEIPIRFINQPLGSTCSIIATLYRQAGIVPEPCIAGLMLAGLLSDTIMLKSPTTTEADRELLGWLGQKAGVEPLGFGEKMFSAGSALANCASIQEMLTTDFKEYNLEERRMGVSQIEVVNFQEFNEAREEISRGLSELASERHLNFAALLVTDIVQQNSQLLVCGDPDLLEMVGYPTLDDQLFELKGVLSRKKQLIPHLLKSFKQV